MDGQHSFFSPTTCFAVACTAFSFIAVASAWRNSQATSVPIREAKEDRPRPRRRIAVDSLYAADAPAETKDDRASALSIIADLVASSAKLSAQLRQDAGGYVAIALLSELSLITASLCQLQAVVCNNSAAIAVGTGLGACFVASTSSLNATIELISEERSSPSQDRARLHNEALQQLKSQKPALDFLITSLSTSGLPPPTPPVEDERFLRPSDAASFGPESSSLQQAPTGLTPAIDSKGWIEPPPEYSPPSSSAAFPLPEKQDQKTSLPEEPSSQPEVENGDGDVNGEALYQAVTDDDIQVLSDLLTAGLDTDEAFGELQRTPLHQAAHLNHCACLSILLRNGASMSVEDTKGDTPLHLAAWAGNVEALSSLLAHGADVDWLSGRDGYSPLWCAISANHIDAARLLLKHGARVSLRSGSGLMPLHQAAVTGQSAMCELLLERGAQVDAVDDDLNSPLHYAATCGSAASVQILLRNGASVEAQQLQGLSPAHWAAHKGHAEVLALLLDYGAPLNLAAEEGATPLHLAANRGHMAAARLLLEKGAKTDIEASWDGFYGTAADMAKAKRHARVAELIRSW